MYLSLRVQVAVGTFFMKSPVVAYLPKKVYTRIMFFSWCNELYLILKYEILMQKLEIYIIYVFV